MLALAKVFPQSAFSCTLAVVPMVSIPQYPSDVRSPGLLTRLAKTHPVLLFFALAYLIGWGIVTPRILFWLGILRFDVPGWWIISSFYAPCIAALCVQWLASQNFRVCRIYDSFAKLVLGVVVGSLLVRVGNIVVPAMLAEKTPLRTLSWPAFASLASYHFLFSGLIPTIGEEIGWRGFALPRLQERFGPVLASVLVGLMWAGFMLPALTLVQMWSTAGVAMYAIAMISLSLEITFAVNLSGGSIIVAVLMHFFSQGESITGNLIVHAHPRSNWQWIWSLSNLLVPAILVLATRGRLGRSQKTRA